MVQETNSANGKAQIILSGSNHPVNVIKRLAIFTASDTKSRNSELSDFPQVDHISSEGLEMLIFMRNQLLLKNGKIRTMKGFRVG